MYNAKNVNPIKTRDVLVKLSDGQYAVAYLSEKWGWQPTMGVEGGDDRIFLSSEVVEWCELPQ